MNPTIVETASCLAVTNPMIIRSLRGTKQSHLSIELTIVSSKFLFQQSRYFFINRESELVF